VVAFDDVAGDVDVQQVPGGHLEEVALLRLLVPAVREEVFGHVGAIPPIRKSPSTIPAAARE